MTYCLDAAVNQPPRHPERSSAHDTVIERERRQTRRATKNCLEGRAAVAWSRQMSAMVASTPARGGTRRVPVERGIANAYRCLNLLAHLFSR